MMKSTMREHLAETFPNGVKNVPHEQIAWAIGDWLSCMGMEWTDDDRAAVVEIGEDPDDYMRFDDEQEMRIEEIYAQVLKLCALMVSPLRKDEPRAVPVWLASEIADEVGDMLANAGYQVFFPTHVNDGKKEYISDTYN